MRFFSETCVLLIRELQSSRARADLCGGRPDPIEPRAVPTATAQHDQPQHVMNVVDVAQNLHTTITNCINVV